MNGELEIICGRLAAALTNGTYQGLLLTLAVGLGVKLLPRGNAATRHWIWFATLLLAAALPVAHFLFPARISWPRFLDIASLKVDHKSEAAAGQPISDKETTATVQIEPIMTAVTPILTTKIESRWPGPVANQAEPSLPAVGEAEATDPVDVSDDNSSVSESTRDNSNDLIQPAPRPVWKWNWRLALSNKACVIPVGLWLLLAAMRIGGLAWQCRLLHFLKKRALPAPKEFNILFERLKAEFSSKRKIKLLLCAESASPMAMGFVNATVILPARMFETAEEPRLEQILRHELAHLNRGDDWVNLLQQVLKAAFFFHPAICWLSHRMTIEREIACDDYVLSATRSPKAYALFLTEFASRLRSPKWAIAPAAWSNKKQLKERINMILDPKRNASPRPARVKVGVISALALLIAIVALQNGPRLAFASEGASAPTDPARSADLKMTSGPNTATIVTQDGLILTSPLSPPAPDAVQPPAAGLPPEASISIHSQSAFTPPSITIHPSTANRIYAENTSIASVSTPDALPAPDPSPDVKPKAKKSKHGPDEDGGLEQRLDRLEKLVHSLADRENREKHEEFAFNFKDSTPSPDVKWNADQKKWAEDLKKSMPSPDQLKKVVDDAMKAASDAMRESQQQIKAAQKAAQAEAFRFQHDQSNQESDRKSGRGRIDMERRNLERNRAELEKQLNIIEAQLDKLEAEQDRMEEARESKHDHDEDAKHDHDEDKVKNKNKDKVKNKDKETSSSDENPPAKR